MLKNPLRFLDLDPEAEADDFLNLISSCLFINARVVTDDVEY